jgi:hypothetical protein
MYPDSFIEGRLIGQMVALRTINMSRLRAIRNMFNTTYGVHLAHLIHIQSIFGKVNALLFFA